MEFDINSRQISNLAFIYLMPYKNKKVLHNEFLFLLSFVEYISLSIKLIVLTPHDQQRNKNCFIFGTIDVVEIYNEDSNNVIEIIIAIQFEYD